ncbi:MAG: hypothetical protein ACP5D9_05710 [Mariniphaga sp.]
MIGIANAEQLTPRCKRGVAWTLKRMKQLEKLSPEDKLHVFAMLDTFFAKNKLQSLLV